MPSFAQRDIARLLAFAALVSLAEPACGSNQSGGDDEDGSGAEDAGGEAGSVSSGGSAMGATGGSNSGPGGANGEGGEATGGDAGRAGTSGATGTSGEGGESGATNEGGEGGSSGTGGAGGGAGTAASGGSGAAGAGGTAAGAGGANGGSAGSGVSGPCTGLCPMGFTDYPMNPYPGARVYADSGFCFSWVGALSGGICGPDIAKAIPLVYVNGAERRCDSRNTLDFYGPWPAPRNGGYCFVVDTGTSDGFFINVWQ